MATDLKASIDHIVIVIMENRSFDHMLGYLNVPPWNTGRPIVDGIRNDADWLARYTNYHLRKPYPPHPFTDKIFDDPPHTRQTIAIQLSASSGAAGSMTGFIDSYALRNPAPRDLSHVMGYYLGADVPVYDFFARTYAVCERWFSCLPAGTQPNRLMAMAGETLIHDNARLYLPDQDLVYDWLTARGITWRVYHDGIVPFMGLMRKWMDVIHDHDHKEDVTERPLFRWFDHFESDLDSQAELPHVVFIEPDYTDIPFMHTAPPNDDHPPSSVDAGQRFVRRVYRALTRRPDIWQRTVMIVTYDEHGGFFDHVEPPLIETASPTHAYPPFTTLGTRVPAFIVSPYVDAGVVVPGTFDHTSILKFLAERFADNGIYSDAVERRLRGTAHLDLLSASLTRETARTDRPQPSDVAVSEHMSENEAAFHRTITHIREHDPERISKYLRTDIAIQAP